MALYIYGNCHLKQFNKFNKELQLNQFIRIDRTPQNMNKNV